MKDDRAVEEFHRQVFRLETHVCAGVAIEDEIAFAAFEEGDERETGARFVLTLPARE